MTEGQRIMKHLNEWLGSEEGMRCLSPGANNQYLRNRLICAYQEGWNRGREDLKTVRQSDPHEGK